MDEHTLALTARRALSGLRSAGRRAWAAANAHPNRHPWSVVWPGLRTRPRSASAIRGAGFGVGTGHLHGATFGLVFGGLSTVGQVIAYRLGIRPTLDYQSVARPRLTKGQFWASVNRAACYVIAGYLSAVLTHQAAHGWAFGWQVGLAISSGPRTICQNGAMGRVGNRIYADYWLCFAIGAVLGVVSRYSGALNIYLPENTAFLRSRKLCTPCRKSSLARMAGRSSRNWAMAISSPCVIAIRAERSVA